MNFIHTKVYEERFEVNFNKINVGNFNQMNKIIYDCPPCSNLVETRNRENLRVGGLDHGESKNSSKTKTLVDRRRAEAAPPEAISGTRETCKDKAIT